METTTNEGTLKNKTATQAVIGVVAAAIVGGIGYMAGLPDKPKPVQVPPQHALSVFKFGNCEYLVTENPFFMLHRADCTNHPAPHVAQTPMLPVPLK